MKMLVLPNNNWITRETSPDHRIWKLGLSIFIGLLLGALVVTSPYLPLSSDLQKLVLVLPLAFLIVALFINDLEKLILFAIAISVPLNFDISLIISPYARNVFNIAQGNRTIVALTELRLSLTLCVLLIGYFHWLLGRPAAGRKPVRFFASTTIPALGLIFIAILSVLQAQDVQLSFFRIAQLVELFLIYFYLANNIRKKQDLQFFVVVLMGAMLAESLLMIIQWQSGWSFSFAGIYAGVSSEDIRTAGTLGTANSAGGMIAAHLALVCALFWHFSRPSPRIFTALCFIMGCIALIATGSRAAWGGFIVAVLGFMLIGWRRGWVQPRSLVLLLMSVLIIGGILYRPIYTRLTTDDRGSAASRPMMFRLAWNVIQSSPSHLVFGVGANNYALVAPAYNSSSVGNLGYIIDSSVHNAYLLSWAETGLAGLLCLLCFLAAPLVKAWKHIQSPDRFVSLLALGLGCGLLVVCIHMLVDPYIARPKMYILWLLVALVASLSNFDSEHPDYANSNPDLYNIKR